MPTPRGALMAADFCHSPQAIETARPRMCLERKKPPPAVSGRRLGWKVVPLRGYQMKRALYWNSRPECVAS
jgi:hypothetical protein